jgi:hypothetical protein
VVGVDISNETAANCDRRCDRDERGGQRLGVYCAPAGRRGKITSWGNWQRRRPCPAMEWSGRAPALPAPPWPPPIAMLRSLPSPVTASPDYPNHLTDVPCHYPGGASGCACRLLPRSYSLPQMAGGSASALSLSRPAQASLTLRPAGSLSRPKTTFVTRLRPCRLPGRAARQLPINRQTLWVDSCSSGDSRLRGALPFPDSCTAAIAFLIRSPHRRGQAVSAGFRGRASWQS